VNVRWQPVQPFFSDLGSPRDVGRIKKLEGRYIASRYFGRTLGPLPFFLLGVVFFNSRSATLI
jgi:hypothetical protein